MELVPIGEAARRLGMRTSALRYYEERGLMPPAVRAGRQRRYGPQELRRLAFIQVIRDLGVSLGTAAAVLDEEGETWRAAIREQISGLDHVIARAESARAFLTHALMCLEEHPVQDCPVLTGMLDRLVNGASFEAIATEHMNRGDGTADNRRGRTRPAPPSRTNRSP
jgi:DNA-binding transcriptional MerR regulator